MELLRSIDGLFRLCIPSMLLLFVMKLNCHQLGLLVYWLGRALIGSEKLWSGGRHLLPSAVSLRTQRATFTALGSSLH